MQVDRRDFINRYWTYEEGEHVVFLGPTGTGKTTFAMDLLLNQQWKGTTTIFDTKARNKELDQWSRRFKVPIIEQWPPTAWNRLMAPKDCTKWTVRPKHTMVDPDVDNRRLYSVGMKIMGLNYRQGNTITYVDECLDATDVGLEKMLRVMLTRGRTAGAGLWTGSQRPAHIPVYVYSSASHVFLANDPDERDRKRLNEIGGVDGKYVAETVKALKPYHWLYIQRKGSKVAIIGP
jgi:hypothetical protein